MPVAFMTPPPIPSLQGARPVAAPRADSARSATARLAASRAQALRAARRHSRLVRLLRLGIPLGVLAFFAVSIGRVVFDPLRRLGDGVEVGPVRLAGSRVTMDAPRLTGYRNDGRPYELVATSAVQDLRNPGVIELNDITARVTLADRRVATIRAKAGVYDTRAETMELDTDVRVTTDDGTDVRMSRASIAFKTGNVVSNAPVQVVVNGTTIHADGFTIEDSGRVIDFVGGVRSLMSSAVDEGLRPEEKP